MHLHKKDKNQMSRRTKCKDLISLKFQFESLLLVLMFLFLKNAQLG